MKKKLYIAYGSNLNLEQMADRCPTAEVAGAGELEGYELLFRGASHSAVATVEPRENTSVPVLLWQIGEKDEAALDRYEGYPFLYGKQEMDVEVNGETISAMVYTMNPGRELGIPSPYYAQIIREGYESAGFNTEYLDDAIANAKALVHDREQESLGEDQQHMNGM